MPNALPASAYTCLFLLTTALPTGPATAQSRAVAEFAVHAGRHDRTDVPVAASLDGVPLHLASGPLQLFEITRARTEALARCGDDQQQLEHAREDLADLARSLLEDARAGAFEPTPELRASLEAAAGANANRHTPPTGESESRP